MRRMSFDSWARKFKPTGEPKEGAGSGFEIDGQPRMFETFGSDLAKAVAQANTDEKKVWTLIDVGGPSDRNLVIVPGYRLCDRMGYFLTEKPWTDPQRDVLV